VLKHNKQIPAELEASLHNHEMLPNPSLPRKQVKLNPSYENLASFEQEPFKMEPKFDKLGGKSVSDEFFVPAPRFAGKIQWEMVDDEMESSTPVQKNETIPKEKYDSVVEENQVLKKSSRPVKRSSEICKNKSETS